MESKERPVKPSVLVGAVECALGDLDDEGSVGEGECLEVGSVLSRR